VEFCSKLKFWAAIYRYVFSVGNLQLLSPGLFFNLRSHLHVCRCMCTVSLVQQTPIAKTPCDKNRYDKTVIGSFVVGGFCCCGVFWLYAVYCYIVVPFFTSLLLRRQHDSPSGCQYDVTSTGRFFVFTEALLYSRQQRQRHGFLSTTRCPSACRLRRQQTST